MQIYAVTKNSQIVKFKWIKKNLNFIITLEKQNVIGHTDVLKLRM